MANQEQVDILKRGVDVWNKWRGENPEVVVDLSYAYLSDLNFAWGNFSPSMVFKGEIEKVPTYTIVGADLSCVDLSSTNLQGADFHNAQLIATKFSGAYLTGSNFFGANLTGSVFSSAILYYSNFCQADLTNAIFHGAFLSGASFSFANLCGASLVEANMGFNTFALVDLSTVKGLETIFHEAPSSIDLYTILSSQGNIPVSFLRGAGVPDTFIEYARSLINNPIDYYTCFISYSSKDQEFAERLYADLQAKGVRCWYAPEDLKIGDKVWHKIDESIRLYDKLLVVLSENSVASSWVENEVMAALEKEQKQSGKTVLFPIKLDETVMEDDIPWAASMRRSRHIGDFTKWKYHTRYQKALDRLLRDLKARE